MYKPFKMKAAKYANSPMQKNFPDLSGDGKVTQKDILMGKDVIPTPNKKYKTTMKKMGCAMCNYGKKKCTCGNSPMSKRGCKKCKSAMCMCGPKHKK